MTALRHEIIESIRQQVSDLTIIPRTEYCVRHIHNKTNNPNIRNSNQQSNRIITQIGISSSNPLLTDSCVHLNTARYVLSCSKYFEQPKTLALAGNWDFLRSRESFQTSSAVLRFRLNGVLRLSFILILIHYHITIIL